MRRYLLALLFVGGLAAAMALADRMGVKLHTPPLNQPPPRPSSAPAAVEKNEGPCTLEDDRPLTLEEPYIAGPLVYHLQTRLQQLGLHAGPLDGTYGPLTARAVEEFQRRHGLKANGAVDERTWAALGAPGLANSATAPAHRPRGQVRLLIDTWACTLTVYDEEGPFLTFPVAVGARRTPSPVGDWTITQKDRWGGGFGTRWLRLSVPWGKYGIHGTNKPHSIGWPSSHGCIRMFNRDVERLYEWVQIGTPVKIIGSPLAPFEGHFPLLRPGDRGPMVLEVQKYLREAGYYRRNLDGIFGPGTQEAVRNFQAAHHLPVTGEVNRQTYRALGIVSFE
ncbi:MAG: peptidoglycan-binding protein [Bacillota bacterium]|nr:peptidoglycan-binding protein [Bacillota bacterium]